MFTLRSLRELDWTLLILALILCGVGVLQIYSATQSSDLANHWWKQLIYIAAGLVLFYLISQVDYHTLVGQSPALYVVFGVVLFCLLILSRVVLGAKRWISIGAGLKIQPSEFMKLVLILFVARFLSELKTDSLSFRDLLKLTGLVLIPFALVALQPDLGTSLCYLPILAVGVLLAGLSRQQALAILFIFALVIPVGWFALKDYQKARITSFMDPESDPQGSGYQVQQSKIAVGSGGMWGLGVTRGMQIQLRFTLCPYGLYLRGVCRGTRLRRRGHRTWVIFSSIDANFAERSDRFRQGGYRHLYGSRRVAAFPRFGECRNGCRADACGGDSLAADELRWIEHSLIFPHAWAGQQCPPAQISAMTMKDNNPGPTR